MKKYEFHHAGNMLPDYWGGHHLPVVQIAIHGPMTIHEICDEIKGEVNMLWDHYEHTDPNLPDALHAAADRLVATYPQPSDYKFFKDIEQLDESENTDLVYAFFVAAEI